MFFFILQKEGHIAKITALPRVDKKSVFLRSLFALIKCWKAVTSTIYHHVNPICMMVCSHICKLII